jgi:hypothetical protein
MWCGAPNGNGSAVPGWTFEGRPGSWVMMSKAGSVLACEFVDGVE